MVDKRNTIEKATEILDIVLDGEYFRDDPEFCEEISHTRQELEQIYHELDDTTS
jgi:hypothetical protein